MRCKAISAGALGSVALLATAQAGWADDNGGDEIPFAEADLFLELNDTDGDLGLHALIDGDAWRRLEIEGPNERRLLFVRAIGRLAQQGLTELFFESAEPSFDELAPEAFFRRFPAGTYEIEGRTLEGEELESEVELSHVLPAPPTNISVDDTPIDPAEVDCDEGPIPSVGDPVTISWDPVTQSHPDLGEVDPLIEIVGYQVVVEREEPTLLVLSVDLPPSETRLAFEVPSEFIALGEEFKFEILVREASGNQTAVESCFAVE